MRIKRCNVASPSKYFDKLYADTFWSRNFKDSDDIENTLCNNRDLIAERYGLKKNIDFSNIQKKYYKDIIVYNFDKIDDKNQEVNAYCLTETERKKELKRYMTESLINWSIFTWARDHIEYYTTNDGNIVSLFSMDYSDPNEYECIIKSGYKLIEPIYDLGQKTYVKVIQKQ